jgi:GNAT superfamily N-acetyltransferase
MNSRRYTPNDDEVCLELFRSNVPLHLAAIEEDDYRAFLDDPFGDYYVFEDERGPVACGGLYVDDAERWVGIIWTMVRGDLLGQGIGRQMFAFLVDQIPESQRHFPVYLDTSQKALAFWEKMGFKVYDEQRDGYAPGLHRYDMKLEPAVETAAEEKRNHAGPNRSTATGAGSHRPTPGASLTSRQKKPSSPN